MYIAHATAAPSIIYFIINLFYFDFLGKYTFRMISHD
jgi:hypothetical protein